MAMDPGALQQILAQRLQQSGQGQAVGGMQPRQTPLGTAAQLAQKAMLVKALQNQQMYRNVNQMQPQINAQMQNDPRMQQLQQSPQMPPPQLPVMDNINQGLPPQGLTPPMGGQTY